MTRALRLAAGVALVAAGCARQPASPAVAVAADAPTLRIGTSGDYAPFSRDGAGFDVDVAERMAADLGYGIEWVPFRWPELAERMSRGDFDVVMSGITWRPERDVAGFLSRAVASGGPCVVGAAAPARVAVNRGGALEKWARARLAGVEIVAVDDNLSLGRRFAAGEVDAFVTDSFEITHLARPEWPRRCEPPRERKVYWVAPARAAELGPALERWLALHEPELDLLRARWLGSPAARDGVEHVLDLAARRMALMPAVGAWKRARGEPIEDPAREARVLEHAGADASAAGLDAASVQALFRRQIELARAVQARTTDAAGLELETELRPAISRLGERLVSALAEVAPIGRDEVPLERLALFEPWLGLAEQAVLQRALLAVRPARGPHESAREFKAPEANSGREAYSAWFADSDGRTLYFGLSPFWTPWWQGGGDATADLREPGDHLIGRFDLARERFLPPLRVRRRDEGARGSVWDVLAHSSGRVWYTTFFEEIGSVRADGGDVRHYSELGVGWNELVEGPGGNVYATRYGDASGARPAQGSGSVAMIAPDGTLLAEHHLGGPPDSYTAPKSLAVDPASGEVWLNTDSFGPDGVVSHETIRLAADGRVLERTQGPEELLFPAFDARGRAWLALRSGGHLRVRVLGAAPLELDLGELGPADFAQELRPTPDGGALVGRWSGRVQRVRPAGQAFAIDEIRFELPPDCRPPTGRSALYTPVVHGDRAYATLFCGARVLRAPLPR